jgi:cbb3-type cytochrome oxidase subunit 3
MAITIAGGLFAATLLTILFLPALYAVWFRVRRPEAKAEVPETEAALPAPPLPIAAE